MAEKGSSKSRRGKRRFEAVQGDHVEPIDSEPATPSPPADAQPAPVADADDDLAPDTDDPLLASNEDAGEQVGDESIEPSTTEGPHRRRILVRRDLKTRIDVYLQNRLKGISRNRIQKLIDSGGVTINDKQPKPSTQIKVGDVIDVILPPQGVKRIEPENIPLDVLYEDQHFIVLNKQAGLIVHPARSNLSGTLLNGLAYRMKQRVEAAGGTFVPAQTRGFSKNRSSTMPIENVQAKSPARSPAKQGGTPGEGTSKDEREEGKVEGLSTVGSHEFRPGIIHRLDKNTTGCIVIGKSDEAHWGIARQFEHRSTLKVYLAVVHGNFDPAHDEIAGAVDEPIGKHPTIREAMSVRHDSMGKRALTLYRVREQYHGYALVELEIKTGRTHQIRVHMAYIGHPVAGDILYGGHAIGAAELDNPPQPANTKRFVPYARTKEEGQRLDAEAVKRKDMIMPYPALHATLLRFVHPITQKEMTFTAPIHDRMFDLVEALRERPSKLPIVKQGIWIDLDKAIVE